MTATMANQIVWYSVHGGVYPTRYMADIVRKESPLRSSAERIVKVDGGYRLMKWDEYYTWKGQR